MSPESVILKGKGQSARKLPSYKHLLANTNYEVWTLNDDPTEDTTRHFEIHSGGGHHLPLVDSIWGKLRHAKCLYISPSVTISRPYQTHYPIETVKQMAGENIFSLSSTFAYMVALAALEKIKNIYLVGCDFMSSNEKRTGQKQDIERWCYLAAGRGCNICWPARDSTLFSNRGTIYQ